MQSGKSVGSRIIDYPNVPKFSDRWVWANSVDSNQIAPRVAVWSGSTLFVIPSAAFGHMFIWKIPISQILGLLQYISGVRIFGSFTVSMYREGLVRLIQYSEINVSRVVISTGMNRKVNSVIIGRCSTTCEINEPQNAYSIGVGCV